MTFFDLKARYVIIKFKFLLTKRELSLVSNYKTLKNLENNDFLKKISLDVFFRLKSALFYQNVKVYVDKTG